MAARHNEVEADGLPTVDAIVGGLLEAQTAAHTRLIGSLLKGLLTRG
jgi:hypothetical protein